MTKGLIIFGSAEIAELAFYYFKNDSNYTPKYFTVDDEFVKDDKFLGLPIIPFSEIKELNLTDELDMHIAVSYQKLNRLREEKYQAAKGLGFKMASYLSSKSTYWPNNLSIGDNCFILENQTIQPNVKIGNNVMIWSGNHLGHGSVIRDHAYISSHVVLCGHTEIGKRSFLGVNTAIKDFVKIGNDCFVGMNTCITQNMRDDSVAVSKKSEILEKDDRRARILKKSYFKI